LQAHTYGLPPWFGLALTTVVCGAAFWKGGREEQAAAGALLLCWVGTLILRDPRWQGTQWGALVIDCVFLAVLTGIALTTARFWPLFAAAFQLLAVVTHGARMVDPSFSAWAYATANIVWTQLVLIAMAAGVWNTWSAGRQPTIADDDPITDPGATRR
jgi:hypothetical protein